VRSKADDMASRQLSFSHGTETKKQGKTKNKNRVAEKKRSGQKSVKAVLEEEVKLLG